LCSVSWIHVVWTPTPVPPPPPVVTVVVGAALFLRTYRQPAGLPGAVHAPVGSPRQI